MITRSDQVGELMEALAKAQGEFTAAIKEITSNAFVGRIYKYADLAANISAVRPALSKHGIALLQFTDSDLERQTGSVTTSLYHGEQFMSVSAEAPALGRNGFDVQSLGACWTYLRRYTLQAIVSLASEDEDGESLVGVDNKPLPQKAQPHPPSPPPPAKADSGPFMELDGNKLTCIIRGVKKCQTKASPGKTPKDYLEVTWNGYLHTANFATCWDTGLFDALSAGIGKEVLLQLKEWKDGDKWNNITDVLLIQGVGYKDGQPYQIPMEAENEVAESLQ